MPARNSHWSLADYDYRELGRRLRPHLEQHAGGWRGAAAEIGVTAPDLSRLMAGQAVSAAKIIAVCDWLKVSFRAFYIAPKKSASAGVSHGKSTETEGTGKAREPDRASGAIARPVRSEPRSGGSVRTGKNHHG